MARFGTRPVLAGSTSLLLLVLIGLGMILSNLGSAPGAGQVWATYLLVGGCGGFAGIGMAALYTIMAMGYPSACRAGGIGFGLMMGRIGGIIASYSGGYLLESGEAGFWPLILTLAGLAIVACACAFLVDRHMIVSRPISRRSG